LGKRKKKKKYGAVVILQAPNAVGTIWFQPMCCSQAFKAFFALYVGGRVFYFFTVQVTSVNYNFSTVVQLYTLIF
jgi:hypothetical protein